jgi:hypothetical protein
MQQQLVQMPRARNVVADKTEPCCCLALIASMPLSMRFMMPGSNRMRLL